MTSQLSNQNSNDKKPLLVKDYSGITPEESIKQVAAKQLAVGYELSSLMENLPGMTYLCHNDENWTMEYVSEGCMKLTGYEPMDLIGNRKLSYNDLIHLDDQITVWVQIQEALAEKRMFQLVYRILTASGEEKLVWEQGMGIFSANGDLNALTGFISDIINHRLVMKAESMLSDFWCKLTKKNKQG